MLFYVVPYLFLAFFALAQYYLKLKDYYRSFLFFLFALPAISIAVLRGNVGTDTLNYLQYFGDLNRGVEVHSFEQGFEFLARGVNSLGFNERFGVAVMSGLTSILILGSFSNTKNQIILFSLLLFPVFFYDMTMNGLRYGLSFAISAIALDFLYKKNNFAFILLAIAAISIQYSSFLIICVFLIFKLDKKYLIGLGIVILFFIPFLSLNLTYFYDKQDLYRDVASPGSTSGLGPLILFLSIFISFLFYSGKERSTNILFLILALELGSFMLAKITYAGLRFQNLFLFSLIILIKQEYYTITKKNEYLMMLIFLGTFGFLLTVKNIGAVVEDVNSPFLPYVFFWQEKE